MAEERATGRGKFASVSVVEPVPALLIRTDRSGDLPVLVEGMQSETAVALDWGAIIDLAVKIGNAIFGDGTGGAGGGGGGKKGCTKVTINNPDGSSTTVETCPAPA